MKVDETNNYKLHTTSICHESGECLLYTFYTLPNAYETPQPSIYKSLQDLQKPNMNPKIMEVTRLSWPSQLGLSQTDPHLAEDTPYIALIRRVVRDNHAFSTFTLKNQHVHGIHALRLLLSPFESETCKDIIHL